MDQQQINIKINSDELPHEVPIAEESTFFAPLDDREDEQLQPAIINFYSVNPESYNEEYHDAQMTTRHQQKQYRHQKRNAPRHMSKPCKYKIYGYNF